MFELSESSSHRDQDAKGRRSLVLVLAIVLVTTVVCLWVGRDAKVQTRLFPATSDKNLEVQTQVVGEAQAQSAKMNEIGARADIGFGFDISSTKEYPFVVSIKESGSTTVFGGCTASLIAPCWVLTAEHCVDGRIQQVDVWAGSVVRQTGMKRTSAAIYKYPTDNSGRGSGLQRNKDMALIYLSECFPVTADIAPIEYIFSNPQTQPPTGSVVIALGFGKDESGKSPGLLKGCHAQIEYAATSKDTCSSKANEWELCWVFITKPGVDNGFSDGYADSGDSGGPCVISWNGHWIQLGVASWMQRIGTFVRDGYEDVAYYYSWIAQTMALHPPSSHGVKPFDYHVTFEQPTTTAPPAAGIEVVVNGYMVAMKYCGVQTKKDVLAIYPVGSTRRSWSRVVDSTAWCGLKVNTKIAVGEYEARLTAGAWNGAVIASTRFSVLTAAIPPATPRMQLALVAPFAAAISWSGCQYRDWIGVYVVGETDMKKYAKKYNIPNVSTKEGIAGLFDLRKGNYIARYFKYRQWTPVSSVGTVSFTIS